MRPVDVYQRAAANTFYNIFTWLTAPLLIIMIFLCWKVGVSMMKLFTGETWVFDLAADTVSYNGAAIFQISRISRIELATNGDGAANALNIVTGNAATGDEQRHLLNGVWSGNKRELTAVAQNLANFTRATFIRE